MGPSGIVDVVRGAFKEDRSISWNLLRRALELVGSSGIVDLCYVSFWKSRYDRQSILRKFVLVRGAYCERPSSSCSILRRLIYVREPSGKVDLRHGTFMESRSS